MLQHLALKLVPFVNEAGNKNKNYLQQHKIEETEKLMMAA
jgi:hypothetical protein